ncbi:hypothetical protein F5Y16DRAFT_393939 [Xylariaceae sp. FL0255]|nr:hypothetical protein F5Y16DRAFT_393939 [Xylariaceae sp. FL0255]
MRIYPPVPFNLTRVFCDGGDTVDGHFLPARITVQPNSMAASLDPRNFDEPLTFKPGRWLDSATQKPDILEASHWERDANNTCKALFNARHAVGTHEGRLAQGFTNAYPLKNTPLCRLLVSQLGLRSPAEAATGSCGAPVLPSVDSEDEDDEMLSLPAAVVPPPPSRVPLLPLCAPPCQVVLLVWLCQPTPCTLETSTTPALRGRYLQTPVPPLVKTEVIAVMELK